MDGRALVQDGGDERAGAGDFQLVHVGILQARLEAASQALGGDMARRGEMFLDAVGAEAQGAGEVLVAEQIQRMLLSNCAILEFEDLRLQLAKQHDPAQGITMLDRLADILREEIARTELSLLAASRDSRLGFQFECDYVYTPYSLREKLESLRDTLKRQLEERRRTLIAARSQQER